MEYKYKIIIIINLILIERFLKIYLDLNTLQKRLNLSIEYNKIYSNLYFIAKDGDTKSPKFFNNSIMQNYSIIKRKGLCLCTIGKKENLYAREFIEYYKSLGFDKIIIFDNNEIEEEKFEYVLKDYISNKFVEIIDIRGIISVQIPVFNYCYKKYYKLFDWIALFDFDEYLFINESQNIGNYIYNKKFENCQSILFNWNIYDDNDLEKYDNRKLIQRFNHLKYYTSQVKSMVRGGLENVIIPSSHIIGININHFCDSNGNKVFPQTYYSIKNNNNSKAFIKHFYTKTAQEFCNKILKGDVQFNKNYQKYI